MKLCFGHANNSMLFFRTYLTRQGHHWKAISWSADSGGNISMCAAISILWVLHHNPTVSILALPPYSLILSHIWEFFLYSYEQMLLHQAMEDAYEDIRVEDSQGRVRHSRRFFQPCLKIFVVHFNKILRQTGR